MAMFIYNRKNTDVAKIALNDFVDATLDLFEGKSVVDMIIYTEIYFLVIDFFNIIQMKNKVKFISSLEALLNEKAIS